MKKIMMWGGDQWDEDMPVRGEFSLAIKLSRKWLGMPGIDKDDIYIVYDSDMLPTWLKDGVKPYKWPGERTFHRGCCGSRCEIGDYWLTEEGTKKLLVMAALAGKHD